MDYQWTAPIDMCEVLSAQLLNLACHFYDDFLVLNLEISRVVSSLFLLVARFKGAGDTCKTFFGDNVSSGTISTRHLE